jgi:hypothetical protein
MHGTVATCQIRPVATVKWGYVVIVLNRSSVQQSPKSGFINNFDWVASESESAILFVLLERVVSGPLKLPLVSSYKWDEFRG